MLVDKVKIRKNIEILKKADKDPLIKFLSEPCAREVRQEQEENFKNFITLCKEYKFTYIYLGFTEITGCEDKRDSHWPAVWSLVRRLGINGGAGNTDQSQLDMGPWFPYEAHNHWNVNEMRKLTVEEVVHLKFKNVCEKSWPSRYSAPKSYGFELVTLETLAEFDKKYAIT